jgi:hypothetical protein
MKIMHILQILVMIVILNPEYDAEQYLLAYPIGITFSGSYAYIINNDSDSYTQCNVGASGIESASCTTITPTGAGKLNGPFRMAISGNYAYIVNNGNNSYTQCNVGASGIESASCTTITPIGVWTLINPTGIAINGGYAYIANTGPAGASNYTQCNVGASGIESASCTTITPTGGALNYVADITLRSNYAYFPNVLNNSYAQCAIGADGIDQSTCVDVTPTGDGALNWPYAIAFD